jgi:dTDP-L-rhamnose 4-epimerase
MEGKQEALHVNDVVSTNMFALRSKNAVGEVFNVASGTAISVYKLAKKLQKITNTKHLMPIFTEPRAGNIKHCSADISKAEKLLGFRPKIKLEDGLSRLVEQYLHARLEGLGAKVKRV